MTKMLVNFTKYTLLKNGGAKRLGGETSSGGGNDQEENDQRGKQLWGEMTRGGNGLGAKRPEPDRPTGTALKTLWP